MWHLHLLSWRPGNLTEEPPAPGPQQATIAHSTAAAGAGGGGPRQPGRRTTDREAPAGGCGQHTLSSQTAEPACCQVWKEGNIFFRTDSMAGGGTSQPAEEALLAAAMELSEDAHDSSVDDLAPAMAAQAADLRLGAAARVSSGAEHSADAGAAGQVDESLLAASMAAPLDRHDSGMYEYATDNDVMAGGQPAAALAAPEPLSAAENGSEDSGTGDGPASWREQKCSGAMPSALESRHGAMQAAPAPRQLDVGDALDSSSDGSSDRHLGQQAVAADAEASDGNPADAWLADAGRTAGAAKTVSSLEEGDAAEPRALLPEAVDFADDGSGGRNSTVGAAAVQFVSAHNA